MKIQFIVKAWITARQVIRSILLLERGAGNNPIPYPSLISASSVGTGVGFTAGQRAEWSQTAEPQRRHRPPNSRCVYPDRQPKHRHAAPPHRSTCTEFIVSFRGIKSGKKWRSKLFFFHFIPRSKRTRAQHGPFNHQCHFYVPLFFLLLQRRSEAFVCLLIRGHKTSSIWEKKKKKKVRLHQTFMVEGKSLRNSLLLL